MLRVVFYRTESGREPVRDWLTTLTREDKKAIGADIKTVQFGWPLGMPLVRRLYRGVWEVRSVLQGRKARVLFTVQGSSIVLLHGFIKKERKTPYQDLQLAKTRAAQLGDLPE
ncbi:MAG: type II toxin-antitoxin system RelE/ParE family toxin [Gemmatimonadetes bacterium]|nr:type II toxin-antitoxin system RelE/ParE family toxin [Gemmatimonadota bacterium]